MKPANSKEINKARLKFISIYGLSMIVLLVMLSGFFSSVPVIQTVTVEKTIPSKIIKDTVYVERRIEKQNDNFIAEKQASDKKINDLSNTINDQNNTIAQLQSSLKNAQQQSKSAIVKPVDVSSYQNQITSLNKNIAEQKSTIFNLQSSLKNAQQQSKSATVKPVDDSAYQNQITSLNKNITDQKSTILKLQSSLKKNSNPGNNDEVEKLNKQIEFLNWAVRSQVAVTNTLTKENNALKESLAASKK